MTYITLNSIVTKDYEIETKQMVHKLFNVIS